MEAFYIAKMKYEHEARLSTPGQQVGKRAGLGYGGLENRPLGKEPTSWICPCCTMPWVKKGATKCMGCGKKTEPIDTATNSATLEMAGTHWQLTVDDQGNAVWTAARSAGAEGPDTDRARDLKLSALVDVSELATDPMACENPDQASFSDFALLGPGGDQELPHGAGRGVSDGPTGGEAPIARRQGRGPGMQSLPPVCGEGLQDSDPAQRHHHRPG